MTPPRQNAGSPRPEGESMVFSRKLDHLSLADRVYATLQDGMIEGRFPPGTHLVQDTIAEQLGVSRTPVRDALIRLSQDELVEPVGARGYMVVEPPMAALADILEVRSLLEPVAVGQAMAHMREHDLLYLADVNARLSGGEKLSAREQYEINQEFHLGLVMRCPNRFIVGVLQEVWTAPRSRWIWKQAFEHHFDMAASAREHEEIIAMARAGDRAALEALIRAHLGDVQKTFGGQDNLGD